MDTEMSKQERSRRRWTPSLDEVFADLVVKQIELGNRQNDVFDKKTWNCIRNEFNKQTDLNYNNNQLRKHLEVLRQRYISAQKSSRDQNEFVIGDSSCIGFDLWDDIGVQPRKEQVKVKDCPIYDQLCTIFANATADGHGRYAQSSHFEGSDKPVGSHTIGFLPSPIGITANSGFLSKPKLEHGETSFLEKDCTDSKDRKRKRWPETNNSLYQTMDQAKVKAMAGALFDMVAAAKSKMVAVVKKDDGFSISNCIRALDEIENVDDTLYIAAVDLFENPNFRETFLSLRGNPIRLRWLQGKCSKPTLAA